MLEQDRWKMSVVVSTKSSGFRSLDGSTSSTLIAVVVLMDIFRWCSSILGALVCSSWFYSLQQLNISVSTSTTLVQRKFNHLKIYTRPYWSPMHTKNHWSDFKTIQFLCIYVEPVNDENIKLMCIFLGAKVSHH